MHSKILISSPINFDAERITEMMLTISKESPYMLLEPEEVAKENQAKIITEIEGNDNTTMIMASFSHNSKDPLGYCAGKRGKFRRNRHTSDMVLAVTKKARKQGIATALVNEFIRLSKNKGVKRIELCTVRENIEAIHLYQKLGFSIEGTRRKSICINNSYLDEYYLSRHV